MKIQGQSELSGIGEIRAQLGGWPISTAGMSSTSRGLHFDVRDGSHGVELVVPGCDHHAISGAGIITAIPLSNSHSVPRGILQSRGSDCRPGR